MTAQKRILFFSFIVFYHIFLHCNVFYHLRDTGMYKTFVWPIKKISFCCAVLQHSPGGISRANHHNKTNQLKYYQKRLFPLPSFHPLARSPDKEKGKTGNNEKNIIISINYITTKTMQLCDTVAKLHPGKANTDQGAISRPSKAPAAYPWRIARCGGSSPPPPKKERRPRHAFRSLPSLCGHCAQQRGARHVSLRKSHKIPSRRGKQLFLLHT